MAFATEITSPDKISDFLLIECRNRGDVLTNLKLQKLLYYAQAWYLVNYDNSLFTEDFQAWVHGPVLVSEYQRFKRFKWKPITEELSLPSLNPNVVKHLSEIIDIFGVETAVALELMTHNETPWRDARKGVPEDQNSSRIISKESMKSFYKKLK